MAANYVIARRVKERAKALKVRISPAAIEAIDARVQEMLKKAAERAKENKRKTVMAHDI